jgi:hypothetical protein
VLRNQYSKKPSEVAILDAEPTRGYTVIADFQMRRGSEKTVRKEAAKIGADAVIITRIGGLYNRGERWAGSDQQGSSYSRTVATAIKYKQ